MVFSFGPQTSSRLMGFRRSRPETMCPPKGQIDPFLQIKWHALQSLWMNPATARFGDRGSPRMASRLISWVRHGSSRSLSGLRRSTAGGSACCHAVCATVGDGKRDDLAHATPLPWPRSHLAASLAQRSFTLVLSALFGALALVLAAVGIRYGFLRSCVRRFVFPRHSMR